MTKPISRWIARYEAVANLAEIRRRSRVQAIPLIGLGADPVEVACERIRQEWRRLFVPTDQGCEIMLMVLGLALAHARMAYPNDLVMSARSYEEVLDIEPYVPICLTGLQGIGKSTLLRALGRVLPADESIVVPCSGDRFPLVAMRAVVVKGLRSAPAVLRAIAGVKYTPQKTEDLANGCARWIYRCGCCLIALDELQFMTQSEQASALVCQVLLASTYLGVPMVFISNYSLCHRLLGRPPESNQRLLTRPVIVVPDLPDSKDWRDFLAEYQKAVPGLFDFSFVERANDLWNYCAGIKRHLAELLVKSYAAARREGLAAATWKMVERTYHSVEYSVSRRDVEALISYALTGTCPIKNLVCPFQHDREAEYLARLKVVRSQKVADAVNDAALSLPERRALAQIERERSSDPTPVAASRKTRRSPRSGPTTAAELSKNAGLIFGRNKDS